MNPEFDEPSLPRLDSPFQALLLLDLVADSATLAFLLLAVYASAACMYLDVAAGPRYERRSVTLLEKLLFILKLSLSPLTERHLFGLSIDPIDCRLLGRSFKSPFIEFLGV